MKTFSIQTMNKWVLFGISALATLLLSALIFFLFLKNPFASLFASQGEKALKDGDIETAKSKYSFALSLKKNDEAIYLGYADAMAAADNYDHAIELLEQGINRISGAEALYLRKVQVYVEAGRIGAAVDFLDGIDNSYINKKLQQQRPADLSYTPTQGKYSRSQDVELTPRKDETIYYTVNGGDPTLSSPVYKEPIHLSASSTIIAISVSKDGMVSPRLTLTYEIDNANEAIVFEDTAIEQMARAALNRPVGDIYAAQLASVTELSSENAQDDIRSLKDLELFPSLNYLHLYDELLIEDYSSLARLPSLATLTVSKCALNDDTLAQINACSQLTNLNISYNQITSLDAISELTYLEHLDASNNEISSVAAVEYPALISLNLSNNWLSDLSGIETFSSLTSLDVSGNLISDLTPITKLSELIELRLANNSPNNIKSLSSLKKLVSLDISGCGLASLSIVNNFPALTCLSASDNEIASLSTFKKQVDELYINKNPLVDLSPLKDQKNLQTLEVVGTQVKDISCLTDLPQLSTLDITDTAVTDATMLKKCPMLTTLYCSETTSTADLPERIYVEIY